MRGEQEPKTGLRCIRHFEGDDVMRCGARQQKVKHFRIRQRGFRSVRLGEWYCFCLRGDSPNQQGQECRQAVLERLEPLHELI